MVRVGTSLIVATRSETGVTFEKVQGPSISNDDFMRGLETWRRNTKIRIPLVKQLHLMTKARAIGYVGTDRRTAYDIYYQGLRREKSDRPSRWGHGMYITDDPVIACFYSWLGRGDKGANEHWISRVYVRDYTVWQSLNKVWIPEKGIIKPMPDNEPKTDLEMAQSQYDRDNKIQELYGANKPYILMSKHVPRKRFSNPIYEGTPLGNIKDKRFNEMAIFPQIQDALFYVVPLEDNAYGLMLDNSKKKMPEAWKHYHWDTDVIDDWNVKVSNDTIDECTRHKEVLVLKAVDKK
ncbi:hypothetical protein B0T24DRAFT_694377 [Lasiosphaeria ovina]|uniref:Uncharacterized protein n=1 Tax=Lasiosphaeria ovina TaxID=92902 RepID=A0AAE0KM69_9PEZI|nr:hypothetical protein B0T24DRAFT_694377 [Lasiosphaeria ovina]